MKKKSKSCYMKAIEAVIPTYDCNGNNASEIIYSDGTSVVEVLHVDKFIRTWLQTLRIDLYAHRMWAQEKLYRRNGNPIIIHDHMIFISVKMRKPVGAKDGSYGYIQLASIEEIKKGEIYLKNGVCLPCLYNEKTMQAKMKDAKLLGYYYIEEKEMYDKIYRKMHV